MGDVKLPEDFVEEVSHLEFVKFAVVVFVESVENRVNIVFEDLVLEAGFLHCMEDKEK